MSSSVWQLAKVAGLGAGLGCCLYAAADVVGDYTTHVALRDLALLLANEHEELKQQIGHPFTPGAWYNASIGYSGGGMIAQTTLQLQGVRQVTDVTARGIRRSGYLHNAFYNLLGER